MATFFTADSHFGHARLVESGSRPFADVAAMDEALVRNWNAAVGTDDDVWHLGDFSAYRDGRLDGTFWRLNGRKRLIVGNHDEENEAVLALPWTEIPEKHLLVRVDGTDAFLCHYPMLTWPRIAKGAIHLFGHLHGAWPGDRLRADVGADAWGFAPVRLEAVLRRMRRLPVATDLVGARSARPGVSSRRTEVTC